MLVETRYAEFISVFLRLRSVKSPGYEDWQGYFKTVEEPKPPEKWPMGVAPGRSRSKPNHSKMIVHTAS